ncbi:MAG: Uma2 family endonuclease [Synechococcaceae cyanobacterium SM2_3_1]|nr:Uma2 family endonuclease [Synechococcaceae cyanobacterium SM2_3_1]
MDFLLRSRYASVEDYLLREPHSPIRHEYMNGKVYPRSRTSDAHVTITGNIFCRLRSALRGSAYRVYPNDLRLHIPKTNIYLYPDLMVTADPRDQGLQDYKSYPTLILEVYSEATEALDRGEKFMAYRQAETLQEYILINEKHMQVECFRRSSTSQWVIEVYADRDRVRFLSLEFDCSMQSIYEDVYLWS